MAPAAFWVSAAAGFLLFALFVSALLLRARSRPSAMLEDQQAEEEAQAVEEPLLQPTSDTAEEDKRGVSHSIFLSHAKQDKTFVERLYEELLRAGHYPFLDVYSIPMGEKFPEDIKQAAEQTKVGVVTLSDDFMSRAWPMKELELFTNSGALVMPLYFKLTPDDLNSPKKLATWKKKWQDLARSDTKIDVCEWGNAVKKLVGSRNGAIYYSGMSEAAYIKTVVRRICERVPPSVIFHLPHVKGQTRFIEELQKEFQSRRVIGMHGVGGQGKTTLCRVMANFYKSNYSLEPVVLEFPSDEDIGKIVQECKKALKRLNLLYKKLLLEHVDCFDEAMQVMKDRMKDKRIFLALDNVCDHCQKEASQILKVDFHPDSKVLVTSRSDELLKDLLTKVDKALVRPLISVNKYEAWEIIGASFEDAHSLASTKTRSRDHALSLCRFSDSFHPMALQSLGQKLKYMGGAGDPNAIERNLARISPDLKGGETITKLIKMNYDSTHCVGKRMFLDVAVVFRRTGSFKSTSGDIEFEEMRNWLSSLYKDECKDDEIDIQLHRLALAGLVQFDDGKHRTVRVHDLYVTLAEGEAAASSRILLPGKRNMGAVKWPELERVVLDDKCEETVELQLCSKLQLLYASGQKFSKGLQLEGATALRLLKMVDCSGKLNGLKGVTKLEALHLQTGSSLEGILRDVRSCTRLKSLVLAGEGLCGGGEDDAVWLCGLTNLRSIQLRLQNFTSFQRIPDLGRLVQLHELDLRGCEALEEIVGMALPSKLERLRLHGCGRLQKIPNVGGCASLRELELRGCEGLEEIVGMAILPNLEILRLYKCRRLQKISDVVGCASLRELELRRCEALDEIVELALPSNLEILRLDECRRLQKISDVGGCASLRELEVQRCEALGEIVGMGFPSTLKILRLVQCFSLSSQKIPSVDGCPLLRVLDVRDCGAWSGIPLPSFNPELLSVD